MLLQGGASAARGRLLCCSRETPLLLQDDPSSVLGRLLCCFREILLLLQEESSAVSLLCRSRKALMLLQGLAITGGCLIVARAPAVVQLL